MVRHSILSAFIIACFTLAQSLCPDGNFAESASAEKGKGSIQKELPLNIQKIFLRGNKVYITIGRTVGGKIDPGDYSKTKVKVDPGGGKPSRQWTLTDVDRNKALVSASGKIEFDTGIVLEKGGMVMAVLSLGKWETSRRDNLVITPASAGTKPGLSKMTPSKMTAQGRSPAQTPSRTTMMMAKAVNARSATPTPTPRNLDDTGGIRIVVPGEGQTQRPGDSLRVQANFLNQLSNPTAVNYVEFALRKWGVSDVFATHRQPYRQSSDDRTCVAAIRLPATGLPPGSNYYFTASHPEAWGIGHSFTIQSPGEGLVRVLKPNARSGGTPGTTMNVDYQLSRPVSEGQICFELYNLDADGRYGRPVATMTRHYRPSTGSPAEPIHMLEWRLPRDLPIGQYFVQATHPEAWGKSSNFSIRWEGEGHDLPSDYAVADIFKHGRDIKARIRATGGDIADYVEVEVNGVLRREVIRPSGDTDIDVGGVWEVCGNFSEVTIDPNNRLRETNELNNGLEKFISSRDPDGHVEPANFGFNTFLVDCDTVIGSIRVYIHNCSSEPLSTQGIVRVRQVGWIPATTDRPERQLDVHRDFRLAVTECPGVTRHRRGRGGNRYWEHQIPPGECAEISVPADDFDRIDSWLVFTFFGDVTRWPSLTNPYQIKVKFGHWGTTINSRTGEVTRECVYHDDPPHP